MPNLITPELFLLPWRDASSALFLDDQSLHVWFIPCDDAGTDIHHLWPLLSVPEQHRANRCKRPGPRAAYIRAHAGLRLILSAYLNLPAAHLHFDQGPQGKPLLPGSLEFNLTTSGDLALVALRHHQPVGIDCEQVKANRDMLGIARRLFTPDEIKHLSNASEDERPTLFTLYWTALEAKVKMDGRGLFQPPPVPVIKPEIVHFQPQSGYLAAIATPAMPAAAVWQARKLSFEKFNP